MMGKGRKQSTKEEEILSKVPNEKSFLGHYVGEGGFTKRVP